MERVLGTSAPFLKEKWYSFKAKAWGCSCVLFGGQRLSEKTDSHVVDRRVVLLNEIVLDIVGQSESFKFTQAVSQSNCSQNTAFNSV